MLLVGQSLFSIFELTVKMNIGMEWSDDLISDIDKTSENKLC